MGGGRFVCPPPPFMRPLNAAFLGEEGCAAFAPTGKRAAFFFKMGVPAEHEPVTGVMFCCQS